MPSVSSRRSEPRRLVERGVRFVQLYHRVRSDDIAYEVPPEVAGHGRPLGILAWCFYWKELGGDLGGCDIGDPYHVEITAMAWQSDSSGVMLKIRGAGSESQYPATTPYECWYDVDHQKFQSITNIDALRYEIEQARAHQSPAPTNAEATSMPSTSSSSKTKNFAGTWEGDVYNRMFHPPRFIYRVRLSVSGDDRVKRSIIKPFTARYPDDQWHRRSSSTISEDGVDTHLSLTIGENGKTGTYKEEQRCIAPDTGKLSDCENRGTLHKTD